MTEPKFDAILDMDDDDFAEKLMKALHVEEGDTVEIVTPQFARTDGLEVPLPLMDFNRLPSLSEETLKAIGCQKWDKADENGNILWLFPHEWYDYIPEGHMVTDINGRVEPFKKGETDDDMRFGALAYGFMREE